MNSGQLLSLLQLSDPALPIGGYSHSAGLETYVQQKLVVDVAGAGEFVTAMLRYNLHFTDAAFVSLAYDACSRGDFHELSRLDDECTAIKLPTEIRGASRKLGMRLLKIFEPLIDSEIIGAFKQSIRDNKATGNYCICFGFIASLLKIDKSDALLGFYYNAASGMITNCVKLIPIGQQQGQELLFSLQPLIASLAVSSLTPDRDKVGYCCSGFDIRCMQHEALYSRVYMS